MSTAVIVQRVLWFLPMMLQSAAVIFMWRRKLHRELPLFWVFMIFDVTAAGILWIFRHQMPHYFYCYWIYEVIAAGLSFAVIYEVFTNVVKRYESIHRTGFLLYRWIAVALLVIATIMAAMAPGADSSRIIEGILTIERGVRIVQAGLVVFLFIFASYLGLSWRNYSFGIALGFGFFAVTDLALVALYKQIGTAADQWYIWFKPAAYNFTVVIWTAYLLQPQPQVKPVTSIPRTETVAGWDETVTEFLRR